jgi:hypothetical protein
MMKNILTLSTIAIAVVVLLIMGLGTTNFISPAYAPEPADLIAPNPKPPISLTGV